MFWYEKVLAPDHGPQTLRQDPRPRTLRQDPDSGSWSLGQLVTGHPGEISRKLLPGRNLLSALWLYIRAYRGNYKFVLDYLI